jgi:hypothetical protein
MLAPAGVPTHEIVPLLPGFLRRKIETCTAGLSFAHYIGIGNQPLQVEIDCLAGHAESARCQLRNVMRVVVNLR